MPTFIMTQETDSDDGGTILLFSTKQKAIDWALADIMEYDGIEGVVELCDDDNFVAFIRSDPYDSPYACDSPYVVTTAEIDPEYKR